MPAFSEDQINEAKERVRRMHARAGSYLPREEPPQGHNDRQTASPATPNPEEPASENEGDDNAVILMLLLLLGREGADQALLLALLYLLF